MKRWVNYFYVIASKLSSVCFLCEKFEKYFWKSKRTEFKFSSLCPHILLDGYAFSCVGGRESRVPLSEQELMVGPATATWAHQTANSKAKEEVKTAENKLHLRLDFWSSRFGNSACCSWTTIDVAWADSFSFFLERREHYRILHCLRRQESSLKTSNLEGFNHLLQSTASFEVGEREAPFARYGASRHWNKK